MVIYPNLAGELAKKGIKKKDVARCIGVCDKSLHNKLNGKVPFTWPEVRKIQHQFFPEISPDILFAEAEDTSQTNS